MSRVIVIAVYFGALPRWMDLWLESCRCNGTLDFLVVTDRPTDALPKPGNVTFVSMSFQAFVETASDRIGVPISQMDPYKICDLRPMYGRIFEDRIRGYDYWGHCDLDVIWGDIRKFLVLHDLEKYDRFLDRGHLSLYRNQASVNDRFREVGDAQLREIFSIPQNRFFDEVIMNRLYARNRYPHFDTCLYVDVDLFLRKFLNCHHKGGSGNHRHQICYWENGRLVCAYFTRGEMHEKELIYIHFQKRRMARAIEATGASFFIVDEGFVDKPHEGPPRLVEIRKHNGPSRPVDILRRVVYVFSEPRVRMVRDYFTTILWYVKDRIVCSLRTRPSGHGIYRRAIKYARAGAVGKK
jgi:hypothetical protein